MGLNGVFRRRTEPSLAARQPVGLLPLRKCSARLGWGADPVFGAGPKQVGQTLPRYKSHVNGNSLLHTGGVNRAAGSSVWVIALQKRGCS